MTSPPSSSFKQRLIEVTIELTPSGTNKPSTFAGTDSSRVKLSGLRTSVRIQNSGALAGSQAQVEIWGLSQSRLNQLSTLGIVIQQVPRDKITIAAGDDPSALTTVFVGNIQNAYADYSGAPEVPMRFEPCFSTGAEAAINYPATSYRGSTDVATVLQKIAKDVGWGFENSGVSVKLSNPYYAGSAADQVAKIKEHARINAEVLNGVLCVWPLNGARKGTGEIPLVSPETGMINYPSFTQNGIMFRTLFNPRIVMGGQVKVESSIFTLQTRERLQNVDSVWNVLKIDLALDSLVPRGQWMAVVQCYRPGSPAPIPNPTPA